VPPSPKPQYRSSVSERNKKFGVAELVETKQRSFFSGLCGLWCLKGYALIVAKVSMVKKPSLTTRCRSVLKKIIDQINHVRNLYFPAQVNISGLKGNARDTYHLTKRRWSAFEEIINQINDIGNVYQIVCIHIASFLGNRRGSHLKQVID